MNKLLILSDLDKTIIDRNYKLTAKISDFLSVIKRAQNKGHLVGLHSDTPLSVLVEWANKFNMNGPIIGENGSVARISKAIEPITIAPKDRSIRWKALRREISFFLVSNGYLVVDTNDYLGYLEQKYPAKAGEKMIIVNGCREHSLAYYVRSVITDGSLVKDVLLFKKVNDLVLKKFPLLKDTDQDLNPDYTLSIFVSKGANKANAMPVLRSYFPNHKIIMIGDGTGDIVMHDNVDALYAVSNAVSGLKSVADKVAIRAVTEGVIEIINDII